MSEAYNMSDYPELVRKFCAYKSGIQERSPKTVQEYMLDLRIFCKYMYAKKNGLSHDDEALEKIDISGLEADFFASITSDEIYDFIYYAKFERKNGAAARSRKLSAIKSFYKYHTQKSRLLPANPAADIEGHDACRKIAILASLASGKMIDYNDIDTDGITNITLDDVKYAAAMDSVIKLIGYAQFDENGKVYSIVSPMVIKNSSPLAGVDGVFNAIMVTGDCVGDVMFYGKGAGKLPTASAVVADVVDAVKHSDRSKKIFWEKPAENIMADIDSKKFEYFVRTTDSAENVQKIFGKCEFVDNIIDNESAFVTSPLTKSEVEEKLAKLSDVVANIRVMD